MEGLRKAFRTPAGAVLEVLRDVSLTLQPGEMVCVLGPSGAGKSTLLHLVGGLDAADGGEIRLGEFDIARARGATLASFRNARVGFVFQFHHLLPDLTAAENVSMPLLINRVPQREALARALEMLERVGLGAYSSQRISLLSGGEQQRVAIARACITRPSLILADEPTGNLDASAGDQVGGLLASFCRDEGSAVLLATHNERLARLCDRRLFLSDGRLQEQSSAD
ncbi:MAG TPA: ABC transporter ATP-binding protein [Pyrinomonadaceae bacterium]|nr:ABC transporter ATP-binding protein [Pyrinomonadaceae bacterium]